MVDEGRGVEEGVRLAALDDRRPRPALECIAVVVADRQPAEQAHAHAAARVPTNVVQIFAPFYGHHAGRAYTVVVETTEPARRQRGLAAEIQDSVWLREVDQRPADVRLVAVVSTGKIDLVTVTANVIGRRQHSVRAHPPDAFARRDYPPQLPPGDRFAERSAHGPADLRAEVLPFDRARAPVVGCQDLAGLSQHHRSRLDVTGDGRVHGNETVVADGAEVPHRRVDTEETALADPAITRDDHMGRDIGMVIYLAAMADMVARPNHHVVADLDGRLDRLVFENESVVADRQVRPGDGA